MGWSGTLVIGLAVGLAGWALHPARRASRARLWMALLAGALAAVLARMAGNVAGVFHDGDLLEWPVCTVVALGAVGAIVALGTRH